MYIEIYGKEQCPYCDMAERVAQTAVSKIKAAVEQKIPDINREIDKWESEEDNDEDKPKYLN